MQFNRKQIISGLKYTVNEGTAIKDYSIYVHGIMMNGQRL